MNCKELSELIFTLVRNPADEGKYKTGDTDITSVSIRKQPSEKDSFNLDYAGVGFINSIILYIQVPFPPDDIWIPLT